MLESNDGGAIVEDGGDWAIVTLSKKGRSGLVDEDSTFGDEGIVQVYTTVCSPPHDTVLT